MSKQKLMFTATFIAALLFTGCSTTPPIIPVDDRSVQPATQVTRGGTTVLKLLGEPVQVGDPFPSVTLIDQNLRSTDISGATGHVRLVSIVPSLDTQICERQTHILGEERKRLTEGIKKVTISRDLPFAHKRFAEETGFNEILYLSDYQKADFGRATGLLVDEIYLLARAIIIVDGEGIIRYIQVVPEISHLPDMQKAFEKANAIHAQSH